MCAGQTVAGRSVGGPQRLSFGCTCFKRQRAELKGLDIGSLVIECIRVNRTPKMQCRRYRAHGSYNRRGGCRDDKNIPEETKDAKT